jgi:hypothetical protein
MKRLVISNGPWTTLIISAILRDKLEKYDSIYFMGYFRNATKESLERNFGFASINIKYNKYLNIFDYKTYLGINTTKLSRDINLIDIDEIYIPINSTTKKWFKFFNKYSPKAKFHFYEEGLMSYIKVFFDSSLRKIMINTNNHFLFYDDIIKRTINKDFPNIEFNEIISNNLKSSIESASLALECKYKVIKDKKYALILPQYYYQTNNNKLSKTIDLYRINIQKLVDSGYTILFKEHPKSRICFFNLLQPFFSNNIFNKLEDITYYPIELFISKLNIDIIFSVYSTSLFTNKYLFNIKTITSSIMLNKRISFFSIYPSLTCIFTKNLINNIENENNDLNNKNKSDIFYTNSVLYNIYIKILRKIL